LTREEQVILARRLRASVILDAADEAIYKINRRANVSSNPDLELLAPSLSSRRSSMDSHSGARGPSEQNNGENAPQSFYDTFRWLDEEEDLDLRLFLDDYHANLRDDLPSPKQQRPSFRRHLSISKIPFGRSSISQARPTTKNASLPGSPARSPSGSVSNTFGHARRKSRALSLITPKQLSQDLPTAFDPEAAHYQDPEARLKLRVYLASPQKFDEAIEFGFPSTDAAPEVTAGKGTEAMRRRQSTPKLPEPSWHMRSFLADDDDDDERASLESDQPSMADPDSPQTPETTENRARGLLAQRPASTEPIFMRSDSRVKPPEGGGYAQVPVSSREMTLRMTLTRPDLRAHEDQIYGWQQRQAQHQAASHRKSTTMAPLGLEGGVTVYSGDGSQKENMDRASPNLDPWGPDPADKGVMKRIWNRVRRS